MRKIRLSDNDVALFDMEISPSDYVFYQRHKDAFRTMWKEQGKSFWTKFAITFRSFTVKYGVIQQMSIESPKFENLIDQAFIFIHDQYVDGKANMAKNFIEDVAKLAQNHDKFPALDSKSFAHDPFYLKETRELFRRFFGMPDQKSSYLKVYILSPIYMRFGGAICRCLIRWKDAELQDPNDESYWDPPKSLEPEEVVYQSEHFIMCDKCQEESSSLFIRERMLGRTDGPKFVELWQFGDPRKIDPENPLFGLNDSAVDDWREDLTIEQFHSFLHYVKKKYGTENDQCKDCLSLKVKKDRPISRGKKSQKKSTNNGQVSQKDLEELREIRRQISEIDLSDNDMTPTEMSEKLMDLVKGKVTPQQALTEAISDLKRRKKLAEINEARSPKKKREKVKLDREKILEEAPDRRDIFCSAAKVTDEVKYGILSNKESETEKKLVGGFRVFKIDDKRSRYYEASITVAAMKSEEDEATVKTSPPAPPAPTPTTKSKHKRNKYILSAEMLQQKIENLPQQLEWFEGVGWCAAVLNYIDEEKDLCAKQTNFTIKVHGADEDTLKRTMFKLLMYVAKRKQRPSLGWMMDDDDVVTCILPKDCPHDQGLTITVSNGFGFHARLTDQELKTMQKPGMTVTKRLLMSLQPSTIATILEEEGGHDKLKLILSKLSQECAEGEEDHNRYDFTIPKEMVDRTPKKGISVEKITETELWKQILLQPSRFELFVMINLKREEDMQSFGLRKVNLDFYIANGKPVLLCRICKKERESCPCPEHLSSFPDKHLNFAGANTVAYRVPRLKLLDFEDGLLTEQEKMDVKEKGPSALMTVEHKGVVSPPGGTLTVCSQTNMEKKLKIIHTYEYPVNMEQQNATGGAGAGAGDGPTGIKEGLISTYLTTYKTVDNLKMLLLPECLRPPPAKPGVGRTITLAIPGDEPDTLKTIQVNPESLPPGVITDDQDTSDGYSILVRVDPDKPLAPQLANKTIKGTALSPDKPSSIKLGPFVPEDKIKEMQQKREQKRRDQERIKEIIAAERERDPEAWDNDPELNKRILDLLYIATVKESQEKKKQKALEKKKRKKKGLPVEEEEEPTSESESAFGSDKYPSLLAALGEAPKKSKEEYEAMLKEARVEREQLEKQMKENRVQEKEKRRKGQLTPGDNKLAVEPPKKEGKRKKKKKSKGSKSETPTTEGTTETVLTETKQNGESKTGYGTWSVVKPEGSGTDMTEKSETEKAEKRQQTDNKTAEKQISDKSVTVSLKFDKTTETEAVPITKELSLVPYTGKRDTPLLKHVNWQFSVPENEAQSPPSEPFKSDKVITDLMDLPPDERARVKLLLDLQRKDRVNYEEQRQKELNNLIPKTRNDVQRARLRQKIETQYQMFETDPEELLEQQVTGKKNAEKDAEEHLRMCSHCEGKEPLFKSFKKCQKCKEEGWLLARYYCGRDCQVVDWKFRHKQEHKDRLGA